MWGRTLNPYSRSYTCGGTSGGEAALLGMDGAVLGWGTDIGGSLRSVNASSGRLTCLVEVTLKVHADIPSLPPDRIPASFCGVYSVKPGWGRISTSGAIGTLLSPDLGPRLGTSFGQDRIGAGRDMLMFLHT